MKVRNIWALALAIGILAACNIDEQLNSNFNPNDVTFYASNGDKAATRTVLQADGTINWLPQDEINVFYGQNQSARFVSDNSNASEKVAFNGSMKDFSYSAGTMFQAVYPFREDNTFDGDAISVTIPSEQAAVAGTFADDLFVSIARTDDFNLQFYNVCGGIKFYVTEPGVASVTFSGNADEPIAGKVKVGWSNEDRPEVKQMVTRATSITIKPENGETFQTGTWYYLAALPTNLKSGYKFTLTKTNGTSTVKSNTSPATIKRAVWGVLKDMDGGLEYIQHVPNNEIWYTTTDGKIFNTNNKGELESNTYLDGIGKMVFKNSLNNITFNYFNGDSRERIETVMLPESVTTIGIVSFAACPNLKTVDMPGVKTIEQEAFSQSGLSDTLDLPETLEEIGAFAFSFCQGLTEIIIPKNVKKIGEGAFFEGGYTKAILKPLSPPVMEGVYTLDSRYNLFGRRCLIYVPEESLEAYQTADNWKDCTGFMTVEGKMPQDCWYTSTDYSHDGEVVVLQQSTVGKGINLLFLGDGYLDRDLGPGSKYENLAKLEMENLFGYEPFKSFRDRFNVYLINCVSKNDVYFTPFGHAERLFTYDGQEYRYFGTYEDRCEQYARIVVPSKDEPIFATILLNKDYDGESSFNSPYWHDPGYMTFAFVSNRRNEGDDQTFPHEMGGHGFALLADEYSGLGVTFTKDQYAILDDFFQRTGYGVNVDWRKNPTEVRWKHFLNDPRYSEEGLGVWEGAYVCEYGIYRPSEESIMNGTGSHGVSPFHPNWFNAPSREQIYKQIMKYSEGPDWQYDYETFVEIDAPGRQQAAERYKEFLRIYDEWSKEQTRSSPIVTRAELYSRESAQKRLSPVFRCKPNK